MPLGTSLRRMSKDLFRREGSRHGMSHSGRAMKGGAGRGHEVVDVDLDVSKHEPGMGTGPAQELPPPAVTPSSGGATGTVSPATSEEGTDGFSTSEFADGTASVPPSDEGRPSSSQSSAPVSPVNGSDRDLAQFSDSNEKARTIELSELGSSSTWRHLGSGEFCSAFLTTLDGIEVVVKMLKPEQKANPTAAADLQSETYLMCTMRHPNVLRAIAMGTYEGLPFLVLEKLSLVLANELPKPSDSVSFWARRSQIKKWPLTRSLQVAKELASALHYCHANSFEGCRVLHRDLKPNNIGFMADGRLCLFDFGLAKMWRTADGDDGTETRPLTGNTGSLRYMAPEVALNQPYSHRAEVFAWATVVWQMLAHERPFNDCDVAAFYRRVCHRHERPKIPKDSPPQLAQLLMKCWEVDPAKRPEFEQILPIVSELYDEAMAAKRV